MNSQKIEVIHSEAWVDVMPVQPTTGGTLHAVVEFNSNNHGRHFLKKVFPQGMNPAILLLEIKVSLFDIFIFNPQRATYIEGLQESGQYSSIEIQFEGNKVAEIMSIPIVK